MFKKEERPGKKEVPVNTRPAAPKKLPYNERKENKKGRKS